MSSPAAGRVRTWVVSYDVADDGRRTRLAKLLESRGQRVQWSVFEVLATSEEIAALLERAVSPERFHPDLDSLRCYPLCAECRREAEVRGTGRPPSEPGKPLVL